jgi:hypothetical protein
MNLRWPVALAVGFTLVWASVALTGPSHPAGGDPDIWDRAKPPVHSAPKAVVSSAVTVVDIDMVVYKVGLRQQVASDKAKVDNGRLLTLSQPVYGAR